MKVEYINSYIYQYICKRSIQSTYFMENCQHHIGSTYNLYKNSKPLYQMYQYNVLKHPGMILMVTDLTVYVDIYKYVFTCNCNIHVISQGTSCMSLNHGTFFKYR